LSKKDMI